MNAPKFWRLIPILLVCGSVGLAYAKLPAPGDEQKAKAAEAKAKSDDAAKKSGELLGKAQDRVADRYKKEKGKMGTAPVPVKTAAPAAAAVPMAPAPAAKK